MATDMVGLSVASAFGILGGTGPYGLALATRLAAAGESVLLGSRLAERALAAAGRVQEAVPAGRVEGLTNAEVAARADRVALCIPSAGVEALLAVHRPALAGKLVVDVVVPLRLVDGIAEIVPVPWAASVGELVQALLPRSRVVSAFKNVPARLLADPSATLDADVLVCGEDPAARAEIAALAGRIPRLRGVDAGGIAGARVLEGLTALLVNLNARYRAHTSLRITGLG